MAAASTKGNLAAVIQIIATPQPELEFNLSLNPAFGSGAEHIAAIVYMAIAIASWLAGKPFRELKKLKPKLAPPPSDATLRCAAPHHHLGLILALGCCCC